MFNTNLTDEKQVIVIGNGRIFVVL